MTAMATITSTGLSSVTALLRGRGILLSTVATLVASGVSATVLVSR